MEYEVSTILLKRSCPASYFFTRSCAAWVLYLEPRFEFLEAHNACRCSADNAGFGGLLALSGVYSTVLWTPMDSSIRRLRQKKLILTEAINRYNLFEESSQCHTLFSQN